MTFAVVGASNRTIEAERLIDLARAMLTDPNEEIVVNYLDHALEALHIVLGSVAVRSPCGPGPHAAIGPAMAPTTGRD